MNLLLTFKTVDPGSRPGRPMCWLFGLSESVTDETQHIRLPRD
jgi:hypothetical protein